MKIDLNRPLLDLDGKEMAESNIGKSVANFLIAQREGDTLKLWEWAQKLHKGETLTLDKSDAKRFKELVLESNSFAVIFKAQLIEALDGGTK